MLLDIEMPGMDGLPSLCQTMAESQSATVICSTLTEKNGSMALEAPAAGAGGPSCWRWRPRLLAQWPWWPSRGWD